MAAPQERGRLAMNAVDDDDGEDQPYRHPAVNKTLTDAINAMREATETFPKLHAIRNGAEALARLKRQDAEGAQDALDHLSDMAIDVHGIATDDVQVAMQQGIELAERQPTVGGKNPEALKSETAKAPAPPIVFTSAADWEGQPIPSLRWVVHQRILRSSVAILNGDGAIGKTTIALQLGVAVERWAVSRPTDWLSAVVEDGGAVLFFSAEETKDEIHRRLAMILEYNRLSFCDIPNLHVHCRPDEDAILGTLGRNGIIEPTPLLEQLTTEACDRKAALVIIEAAADVFGGDEIKRGQVRHFMGLLRRLAIKSDSGVLLLQHPSQTGINTGSGTSGSTHWNNAARPRLYFCKASESGERDSGLRTLQVMKQNYGPPGEIVQVRWERGVFVPLTSPASYERAAAEADIDAAYLACLDAYRGRGLEAGAQPGKAYAPAIFESMPQANGYKKAVLAKAQERLFNSGRIEVKQIGPCPSKMLPRIVRKEG